MYVCMYVRMYHTNRETNIIVLIIMIKLFCRQNMKLDKRVWQRCTGYMMWAIHLGHCRHADERRAERPEHERLRLRREPRTLHDDDGAAVVKTAALVASHVDQYLHTQQHINNKRKGKIDHAPQNSVGGCSLNGLLWRVLCQQNNNHNNEIVDQSADPLCRRRNSASHILRDQCEDCHSVICCRKRWRRRRCWQS